MADYLLQQQKKKRKEKSIRGNSQRNFSIKRIFDSLLQFWWFWLHVCFSKEDCLILEEGFEMFYLFLKKNNIQTKKLMWKFKNILTFCSTLLYLRGFNNFYFQHLSVLYSSMWSFVHDFLKSKSSYLDILKSVIFYENKSVLKKESTFPKKVQRK